MNKLKLIINYELNKIKHKKDKKDKIKMQPKKF